MLTRKLAKVWAKSGYDPERPRWLPLWLHLLDAAAVAQEKAVEAARSMEFPGMLIIKESTGGGKTEAAKIAVEILAARMGRSGLLFALPTQATTAPPVPPVPSPQARAVPLPALIPAMIRSSP